MLKGTPAIGGATALAAGVLLLLGGARSVLAHDSPEHVVEVLTARISADGRRPELLWRRATEYRALGELALAEKDLKVALRRQRGFEQARIDLGRVQLAQGKTNAALRTIRPPSSRPWRFWSGNSDAVSPMLGIARAEILQAAGRPAEALAECNRALAADGFLNPEWYLIRCHLQYRLGQFQAAADGLAEGIRQTGNAVLEAEWIDALIDAGQYEEALPRVAVSLAESRCQASWLIRRGRIKAGQGLVAEAQADFLTAISELNTRLRLDRPDFSLLAERGLAYALIGDAQLARRDLATARARGADDWTLQRLERVIGG